MDIDPLCIPKHPTLYCWHCLNPLIIKKSCPIIKDKYETRDYDNVIYTYECFHKDFNIQYSFLEHKGNIKSGYHYIIFSNLEIITNVHNGKTWVQPKSEYNYKIYVLEDWAAFLQPILSLINKVNNYVIFC